MIITDSKKTIDWLFNINITYKQTNIYDLLLGRDIFVRELFFLKKFVTMLSVS